MDVTFFYIALLKEHSYFIVYFHLTFYYKYLSKVEHKNTLMRVLMAILYFIVFVPQNSIKTFSQSLLSRNKRKALFGFFQISCLERKFISYLRKKHARYSISLTLKCHSLEDTPTLYEKEHSFLTMPATCANTSGVRYFFLGIKEFCLQNFRI